jgi:DNA repair exonuclease SbcCD ATPase subunit
MDRYPRGDRYDHRIRYDMEPSRGYRDDGRARDRGFWVQSPRQDAYRSRDRSYSPTQPPPAPVRRHTAHEVKPRSAAAMPSPETSPSEIGVEAEQPSEKRMEKATDPRLRSKVASIQSLRETPQSPGTPVLASVGIAGIIAHTVTPARDVEMSNNADFSSELANLVQRLAKLAEAITRAGAHFGVFRRLEIQYAEKRKAKEDATAKFKGHPGYVEHATKQANTAHIELEKAAKTKAELGADVESHTKLFVDELSATFQTLSDKAASSTNVEALQTQIDSLKSKLQEQQPKAFNDVLDSLKHSSDSVQAFQKGLDKRVTEYENSFKSMKGAVTAQVKAELGEANRQLQTKLTPLLSRCEEIKKDCDGFKTEACNAMTHFKADKASISNEVAKLRAENDALREEVKSLTLQNTAQVNELATLKTSTISRVEFDKFKAEIQNAQQTAKEPPSHDNSQDASKLLEPYINKYQQEIQQVNSKIQTLSDELKSFPGNASNPQVDSNIQAMASQLKNLAEDTIKAKTSVEFTFSRLDGFQRDFGVLKDQIKKLEKQEVSGGEPTSSLVALERQLAESSKRLVVAENTIAAVNNTIRVLSSRYNNLTSETLAHQIAGIVGPVNANALSDIANLKQATGHQQQQIRDIQSMNGRFLQRLDKAETKIVDTASVSSVAVLDKRVKAFEQTTNGLLTSLTEHKLQYTQEIPALKSASYCRKEEVEQIKKDLVAREERHRTEMLKIDEHLNDELETVKETSKSAQGKLETLVQSVKDNGDKLTEVQSVLSKLTSGGETGAVSGPDLRDDFDALKKDVSKEKDSLGQRIAAVAKSIDDLEKKASEQTKPDFSGRMSALEEKITSLGSTVNEHDNKLDAMGSQALNSFTANNRAVEQSSISVRTPTVAPTPTPPPDTLSQRSGSTGRDNLNDVKNIPTGPRGKPGTPKASPFRRDSARPTSSGISNKRRNKSPLGGAIKKKSRRYDDNVVDLTNQEDDDFAGTPMMGGHAVRKDPSRRVH